MPRPIQEIINEISSAKFTSSAGPILELCRELCSDGRFNESASSVATWLAAFPTSRAFIEARMPALILNSYLVKQEILDFDEFLKWEANTDWAEQIRASADSATKLPFTVESIVQSMRAFKAA